GAVADAARPAVEREPRVAAVDQEGGDALAWPALRLVHPADREDDGEVRQLGGAGEVLAAVEAPAGTVALGPRLDGHGVGAGARLAEREALLALAADGRQQVALALAVDAGEQDVG